eukprot:TRINITY_DN15818_c0_g1_i1.p1 TRINITY_DN15818_c0_g1~~TRINITY_DN15818_c0_g1_i1.p1  ORF type:complete len:231 (+),score=31.96 TRINITY_DN15818_c0_g1_i1:191-883(+)
MVDRKVLSYGDVLLRSRDVDLLIEPHWLNDNLIEFYFEYLSTNLSERKSTEGGDGDEVLLIGPSVSFWLLHCGGGGSLAAAVSPLHLTKRKLVLIAVNNNPSVETAEGGSHWSLLCYFRLTNSFHHYDSGGGGNWEVALSLANALGPHMGRTSSDKLNIFAEETPTQTNGYDCGVFLLAIAEVFVKNWTRDRLPGLKEWNRLVKDTVTQEKATSLRASLSSLILKLAASP